MDVYQTLSDETVALRLQQGDHACLEELIRRYYPALKRYLYRVSGGDSALSEELAQETMLQLIKGLPSYDSGRPFRPWLYAIATNLLRNHFKRPEHRYQHDDDEAVERLPDEREPTPEHFSVAAETSRRLEAELQRLPIQQRQIIVLRYVEELPLVEIAQMLDLPLGTVKSRLRLGIDRLRSALEDER